MSSTLFLSLVRRIMVRRIIRGGWSAAAVALLAVTGSSLASGCAGGRASAPPLPVERRAEAFKVDPAAYAELGYRLDWRSFPALSSRDARVHTIEIYDDAIICQETGSIVTLLEPDTGERRWANELANRLTKFVGIMRKDTRVVVSSEADAYILDAATGNLVDRQTFASVVNTPGVLEGDIAVYGTGQGELLGHLLWSTGVRGVKAWGFGIPGSIEQPPVRIGRVIGAASALGHVIFLDPASGQSVGRGRISGGIGAPPAASDGLIFLPGLDQSLYALEPSGNQVWRYRTTSPIRQQPVHADGVVYCALADEGLVAFDSATGAVRWAAAGVDGHVVGRRGDRLIVWDGTTATTIDAARGDVISRVPLPGVSILKMSRFADGDLFAVSTHGVVARFVPRT